MMELDDLQWTAQCYALGDLPAREAAAFEARLAVDEAACEAYADALRLTAALTLARPVVRPAGPTMQRQRASWPAAAAACAALLLGAVALRPAAESPSFIVNDSGTIPLWSDSVDGGGNDWSDDVDADDEEAIEVDDVPEWMVAAAELEVEGDAEPEEL